jgi:enolase
MLINFYLKLIDDHPLITYIEDGICSHDVIGWDSHVDSLKERGV